MSSIQARGKLFIPLWLVWVTAFFFVLAGLGSVGILDNNEGLYAEIPREMLSSNDWRLWVIPHLNGLPYMEKPPLLYWLTAFSFALFGESEWSARVVPALSSLACVGMLMAFGSSIRRQQAGRLAALMFISGIGVAAMSRVLMFDMLLTALLTAALMFVFRFLQEGVGRHLRWSYFFLALALLAKGFVAIVLFELVALGFILVMRRTPRDILRTVLQLLDPWSIALFFAVAAPWHIVASMTEPIFAWFYFINEHVLRFLGTREPHDYYSGAPWYYLPRMLIYLFPWSLILPILLFVRSGGFHYDSVALRRFLLLAWLMPLLFFSISSAKANYYLVAVMPFAAFHLAIEIEERDFLSRLSRAIPGLLMALLSIALVAVALNRFHPASPGFSVMGLDQPSFLTGVLAGLAALSAISAAVAWRVPVIGILAYLPVSAWVAGSLMLVLSAMEPQVSTKQIAMYLIKDQPGRVVYLYRNFEELSSLPFYLKHPIPVIDARSNDLFWGGKLRKNDILLSPDQFNERSASQQVAVVVMDRQLADFRKTTFSSRIKGEKRIGLITVFMN